MDIDANIQKLIPKPPRRNIWRTILIYIIFYQIRFHDFLTGYEYPKKKTEMEYLNEYIETKKQQFQQKVTHPTKNANIDSFFYDKQKYKEMLQIEKNPIEIMWKQRILIEYTMRGNIIMFYDVYKQGFSYYADTNTIPYNLLNAVAMKYTMIFQCCDFYMDEIFYFSPLIQIQEEEKEKKEKKEEKENNQLFAKLKSYKINTKTEIVPEKIKKMNKMIYMGKIANHFMLKTMVTKQDKIKTSYKEFKNMIGYGLS